MRYRVHNIFAAFKGKQFWSQWTYVAGIQTRPRDTFFPLYVYGNFLDAQGHLTPMKVARSGRNSNSSETLCLTSLPASLTKIESKLKGLARRYCFLHYKSMGAFCCHGNHSFDGICSETKKQPFPHPTDDIINLIKIRQMILEIP